MARSIHQEKPFRLTAPIIYLVLSIASPCHAQLVSSTYSELLFLQWIENEDGGRRREVTYQSIPSVRNNPLRPMVAQTNRDLPKPFDSQGQILAVGQSAVFFSARSRFIERVELANPDQRNFFPGEHESICLSPNEDHFFADVTEENHVFAFDARSGSRISLVDRSTNQSLAGGIRIAGVAVSTDGGYVATATYLQGDVDPKFAIEIFELPFSKVIQPKMQKIVSGELLATGAMFSPMAAPAMFWLNTQKLLVLVPRRPANQPENIIGNFLADGENSHELMQLDIATGLLESLFELHLGAVARWTRPRFWHRLDEHFIPRVMIENLEIDLTNRTATKTDKLSGHYKLRGTGNQRSLWHKETELAGKVSPAFVSVSPDGLQVAWFSPVNPVEILGFSALERLQRLTHHSEATGITELRIGSFDSPRINILNGMQGSGSCLHWVPSQ